MPRGAPRLRTTTGALNQVGQRVRERRRYLKLTHDAVNGRLADLTAGRWNPAPQEILHIERASRMVTDLELVALAEALECNPCWLLTGLHPDRS